MLCRSGRNGATCSSGHKQIRTYCRRTRKTTGWHTTRRGTCMWTTLSQTQRRRWGRLMRLRPSAWACATFPRTHATRGRCACVLTLVPIQQTQAPRAALPSSWLLGTIVVTPLATCASLRPAAGALHHGAAAAGGGAGEVRRLPGAAEGRQALRLRLPAVQPVLRLLHAGCARRMVLGFRVRLH